MKTSPRQLEIIEAAGRLLSSGGISNLTTKNLAKEMNFSEAALYRHFKNKDDIIIGMLNYLAIDMNQRLTTTLINPIDPESKLEKMFNDQFLFFSKNHHFLAAVFSDGLWESSTKIHSAVRAVMAVKKKHLSNIIEEGQNQNIFRLDINIDTLTHVAMGTFRLHLLKWKMDNYKFNLVITGKSMVADLIKIMKI